jgi:hypothetical protein
MENVPFPLASFAAPCQPPDEYIDFFRDRREVTTVLDIPTNTGIGYYRDDEDIFEWNREAIYMNWQTYHRQNIFNGVNSYFPRSRFDVQRHIYRLPSPAAIRTLQEFGMEYIVFHKNLILHHTENILAQLKQSPLLISRFESENLAILQVTGTP